MKNWTAFFVAPLLLISCGAFAEKTNGAGVPACVGVTDVCMAANVTATDSKTGKTVTGYQFGEHKRDGHGLWADCVDKIATNQSVPGVTGVTAAAAIACKKAERLAHPPR